MGKGKAGEKVSRFQGRAGKGDGGMDVTFVFLRDAAGTDVIPCLSSCLSSSVRGCDVRRGWWWWWLFGEASETVGHGMCDCVCSSSVERD